MKHTLIIGAICLTLFAAAVYAVDWDAPVSMSVRDTPMQDVLRLLAQQNGFSIVTHSDSLGMVSVAFHDVPLRSALAAILSARGMSARYEGNVIITRPDTLVNPAELETVLLKLRYIDATDAKAMIDSSRILSKKGRAVVLTPSAASRYLAPFGWLQTEDISQRGPKVGDRGEAKSEVLMVSDLPQYIPKIEQIMTVIDHPPRQYSIQARFVETILSKDDNFGINWESILTAQGGTGKRTEWTLGTPPAAVSDATSTASTSPSSYLTFGTLSGTQFKSVLDALQKNGDSKLVSEPRIVAQDRQSSVMEAGITYWIATKQATQGIGGVSETYTYTERLIPVRLIVTPQLIADSVLMMEVQPLVQEITGYQVGPDKQQLPIISSRTTVSRLMMKSSETAIIGGLIKESVVDGMSKVKVLGNIPLIGNLFRQKTQEKRRTDLSIFLTVNILPEPVLPPLPIQRIPAAFQMDASSFYGISLAGSSATMTAEKPASAIAPMEKPSSNVALPESPKKEPVDTLKPTKSIEQPRSEVKPPVKTEPVVVPKTVAPDTIQKTPVQKTVTAQPKQQISKTDTGKSTPKPVVKTVTPNRDTVKTVAKTTAPPIVAKPVVDTTKKTTTPPVSTAAKPAPVDTTKKAANQKPATTTPVKTVALDTAKKVSVKPIVSDTTKKASAKPAAPDSTKKIPLKTAALDTTKKTEATKQPTTTQQKLASSVDEKFSQAEASALFNVWLKAWNDKAIEAYLGCYGDEIVKQGNFDSRKRGLFAASGSIKVAADSVKWVRDGELWLAKFRQTYRSDIKQDSGTKTIWLSKTKSGVKIVREVFTEE